MKAHMVVTIVGAVALLSLAQGAEKKPQESAEPRPLSGDYQVYGGTLSEMQPPTPNDRNLAFMFTSQTAKDLFNYIGPDVKKADSCSGAADYRERRRGHLVCTYTKDNGYACYLGLNLRSGKSDYGSTC
jgi:hypothetical protein